MNQNNNQNLNPNMGMGQNMGQDPNFNMVTGVNQSVNSGVISNMASPTQNVKDDLTKTQVLNFKDVEKISKNGKDNKKIVIIIAAVGVFSIFVGLISQFVFSGSSEDDNKVKQSNVAVDEKKAQESDMLVCLIEQLGNADGTDTSTSLKFVFSKGKLQNYSKTLTINPVSGNENGVLAVQYLFAAYQQYESIPINGYTIVNEQNGTGMTSTINIDLTSLDKNTLTDAHKQNGFTNVEFDLNEEKEMINDTLVGLGYTCQ